MSLAVVDHERLEQFIRTTISNAIPAIFRVAGEPELSLVGVGSGNLVLRQLRITLGHFNIRVAQYFANSQRSPPFIMYHDANV